MKGGAMTIFFICCGVVFIGLIILAVIQWRSYLDFNANADANRKPIRVSPSRILQDTQ
jgi:hypothetical protein